MARVLGLWGVLCGLYLLFAGNLGAAEAGTAAACAALTAGFAVALHRSATRDMRLRAPWPRLVGRTLAGVPADAVRVGWVLLRTLARPPHSPLGAVGDQPFHRGGDGPGAAGRRGLVTLALSLAPNGFVLDEAPGALRLHRLTQAPPKPDRDWPA